MNGGGCTVVLRTGSLGDIVLAAVVTAQLAPVTFVTHRRWAALARRLPGVDRVVGWPDDPLPSNVGRVVDLQGDLRARLLTARMRPGAVSHLQRHDWARRARVWWKAPPPPPVVDRYLATAKLPMPARPWLERGCAGEHLVLVPGAQWETKRWPERHWIALGRRWKGPIRLLGGPSDRSLLERIAGAIGPRASWLAEDGFEQTWQILGTARAVVAGDTGLMHMAGMMGLPLVALFGPTTSSDGFWCHRGIAVERSLPCRPCSRHGSHVCAVGDHGCLEGLDVETVHTALLRELERPCTTSS